MEQIGLCLNVTNKGPIASVSLDSGLRSSREQLRAMRDDYLKRMSTILTKYITHIPWAWPLINATVAVHQDVYDSRIQGKPDTIGDPATIRE